MARSEEFRGKSLEDALGAAAGRVGCRTEDLRFEVIREERGFLGAEPRLIAVRVEIPAGTSGAAPSRSRRSPDPAGARAAEVPRAESPAAVADAEPREVEEDDTAGAVMEGPDPSAPAVEALVRELVEAMGLALEARMTEEDERIVVDLAGPDRDLILGVEGETLDAFQYLVNRMAQRALDTRKRVQLESEGFRSEREEEIREMALATAEQVRRTREAVRLPPMNPYERRIIHVTLSAFEDVTTESEGGGFMKRVVVMNQGAQGGGRSRGAAREGRGPRGGGRY